MVAKCPYYEESLYRTHIIDQCHSKLESMKGTTNIYLCPSCLEVFESRKKQTGIKMPTDYFMKRPFQYCRGNIEKGSFVDGMYFNDYMEKYEEGE